MGAGNLRNKLCRCGSEKKYKVCHQPIDEGYKENIREDGSVFWDCAHRIWKEIFNKRQIAIGKQCIKCHVIEKYSV